MFKEKLALVPNKPGSYQMKNKDGIIIYVGKAKNLKNRLKSYFNGRHSGKTAMLVADIADFEYIVTNSELESLILEITLIKKYNPKYNILLKDDKSYPYIELTKDTYPRLKIVRNVNRKKHKSHLFGPFPNVTAARKTVNIINRMYPLRKCDNLKKEVCLYYHLGECLGYCSKKIEKEKIEAMTEEIVTFLKGDDSIVTKRLKEDMEKASEQLNFEKALELKQMLEDISITLRKQKIDLNKNYNFDLFAYFYENNYLSIQVFFIREGLLFGRHFDILSMGEVTSDELIEYIIQFYQRQGLMVKELIVPDIVDSELLSSYLNVKVSTPKRGDLKKLMDMATENCQIALHEKCEELNKDKLAKTTALKELAHLLNVSKVSRMEAFDNSHLFGSFYVGGMVVFDDFEPLKDEYRKFKLDLLVKDDLSAMREVIYRRYYRVLMDKLIPPDLLVIDGGMLQVETVKEVLDGLSLKIPIIGLVKNDKHRTNQLINQDGEILPVDEKSNLFLYLTRIQDEVHRFAISYHRTLKNKGTLASLLDMVSGIGEKRRKQLLRTFGSMKKIKEAPMEELEKILSHDIAVSLKEYLYELDKKEEKKEKEKNEEE